MLKDLKWNTVNDEVPSYFTKCEYSPWTRTVCISRYLRYYVVNACRWHSSKIALVPIQLEDQANPASTRHKMYGACISSVEVRFSRFFPFYEVDYLCFVGSRNKNVITENVLPNQFLMDSKDFHPYPMLFGLRWLLRGSRLPVSDALRRTVFRRLETGSGHDRRAGDRDWSWRSGVQQERGNLSPRVHRRQRPRYECQPAHDAIRSPAGRWAMMGNSSSLTVWSADRPRY